MAQNESEVVHFFQEKAQEQSGTIDHNKPALALATVKYTLKKKITDAENEGVLVFTTDTGELFVGAGYDHFIQKISDVFVGTRDSFPGVGVDNKLYMATDEKAMYYWDRVGYRQFAEVDAVPYQDVFTVGEEAQTQFILTRKPLNSVIAMSINGLTYFPDDFTYDSKSNTVTWNKDDDEGFSITDSKVVFEYTVLADGDNVTVNASVDNTPATASLMSARSAASPKVIAKPITSTVRKKWKLSASNGNTFSVYYNEDDLRGGKIV